MRDSDFSRLRQLSLRSVDFRRSFWPTPYGKPPREKTVTAYRQNVLYACATNDVDHRLTKPKHPWTNGQVERINRTIKDATVKRYFYESHDQLRSHLRDFVSAYNFARRLKTLKGLTPYEFVCKTWTSQPQQFKLNPLQQMPGLNN